MTKEPAQKINPQEFVDQLYDIALHPHSLNGFIDAWNEAGLDASAAPSTIAPSLAYTMSSSTAPKPAKVEKPQSVPAITRSRPTMSAKRLMR